jgi:hypothetical protein
MPGTGCAEYIGGSTQGCVGPELVLRTVRVPLKGYNCQFYYGALCSSHSVIMPDHSCLSAEQYDDRIKSFSCVSRVPMFLTRSTLC